MIFLKLFNFILNLKDKELYLAGLLIFSGIIFQMVEFQFFSFENIHSFHREVVEYVWNTLETITSSIREHLTLGA